MMACQLTHSSAPDSKHPTGWAGALVGRRLESILFATSTGELIDLANIAQHGLVIYLQPGFVLHTDEHGSSPHEDDLQHRAYLRLLSRFDRVMPGGSIVGLSAAPDRMRMLNASPRSRCLSVKEPTVGHCVLDDPYLTLAKDLGAPTFQDHGGRRYERATIVAVDGRVAKVFHPAIAGRDASQALAWLQLH